MSGPMSPGTDDYLRELYQDIILDHGRHPRNFHALDPATHSARGHNPLCGDRVTFYLQVNGDKIADVSFEGRGCAISTAAASLMTEVLKGKSIAPRRCQIFAQFHAKVTGGDIEDLPDALQEDSEQLEPADRGQGLSGARQMRHLAVACFRGRAERRRRRRHGQDRVELCCSGALRGSRRGFAAPHHDGFLTWDRTTPVILRRREAPSRRTRRRYSVSGARDVGRRRPRLFRFHPRAAARDRGRRAARGRGRSGALGVGARCVAHPNPRPGNPGQHRRTWAQSTN